MGKEKLGQEPAFPILDPNGSYYKEGMSTRLFIATMAMQGICSMHHSISDFDNEYVSRLALNLADKLLEIENE